MRKSLFECNNVEDVKSFFIEKKKVVPSDFKKFEKYLSSLNLYEMENDYTALDNLIEDIEKKFKDSYGITKGYEEDIGESLPHENYMSLFKEYGLSIPKEGIHYFSDYFSNRTREDIYEYESTGDDYLEYLNINKLFVEYSNFIEHYKDKEKKENKNLGGIQNIKNAIIKYYKKKKLDMSEIYIKESKSTNTIYIEFYDYKIRISDHQGNIQKSEDVDVSLEVDTLDIDYFDNEHNLSIYKSDDTIEDVYTLIDNLY